MVAIASLAAHIPIDRRVTLAAKNTLPDRTTGTALFADISGFTALTGVLTRELGPQRGAEELLDYLNPVFEALITKLHHYGGAVISFAGDSITCWFNGDDGHCAVACGLAMQQVMQSYQGKETAAGTPFSLEIKIAISAGPARRFAIGRPDVQVIDVLAGRTLMRMAAAEDLAQKGETVVEASTLARLGGDVTVARSRRDREDLEIGVVTAITQCPAPQPWTSLAPDALSEGQIEPWLLPPVHARFKSGQTFLAEFRPVAALFVRFAGLDYDGDDHAGDKLDAYIRWVQQVVTQHHGYLLQLSIGDKGSFGYVTFGAPVAHGESEVLATAAALDLAAGSTGFDGIEQVQLGISTGWMWAGAYGGIHRCTYGVIGDQVNMAARLMASAEPFQILVTSQVARAAAERYDFRSLGEIAVKGYEKPLSVFEPIGRREDLSSGWHLPSHPLVGRQEELSVLEQILERVIAGQGQAVVLSADAGMGKSHLAAHFGRWATEKGVQVVVGTCESIARNTPYYPWRPIFRALLGIAHMSREEAVKHLATSLAAKHPAWALRLPLLGDLLGLPIPDNPTTASFETSVRQKALFSLAGEMVQSWATQRPLLVAIENAHWMDEASAGLLHAMHQQVTSRTPVLILLTQRPARSEEDSILPTPAGLDHFTVLQLEPLSRQHIPRLIWLRVDGWPSPLLSSILETMTRGNPFYVGELIEAMYRDEQVVRDMDGRWQVSADLLARLQAAGFVRHVEGQWDLKPEADLSTVHLGLPDTIYGLVLAQVDRLPEDHKLTLKVCSVIGHRFNVDLVTRARPQQSDRAQVEDELRILQAEKIVLEEDPISGTFAFRHRITQEVVYGTLLHAQRKSLHRTVAHTLSEFQPEAITQIAHHACLGETWSLSLEYNLLAGQQAKQVYANQQAIDFFRNALHSTGKLPETETALRRETIQLALGELLVSTGQYEAAYQHLEAAMNLAKALGEPEAEARACRWFGRAHELRGEYEPALQWLERGFALLAPRRFAAEEAELALIAGLIKSRQGDYDRAERFCERSLGVADQLDDVAVRARTYNLMGIIDRRRGRSEAALDRFQQSLVQYEQLGNIYGQATSHNLIANGYFMLSRWRLAGLHYRRSLEMFAELGDNYNQALANNNLGGIALKQGRLDEAIDYYQHAIRLLEHSGGSLWVLGALHMNLANTLIQRRELALAIHQLQLAREHFDQATVRDLLPELYGLFAEAALLQGDRAEAAEVGRRSVALARELEMPCEEGHNLRVLGDIAEADGCFEQAEQYYLDSLAILCDVGDKYEQAKTELSLARLYSLLGQVERAEAALSNCEQAFELLEARLDLEKVKEIRRNA